ncbi:helix-turn-helix transcriptional regulator [Moritella marina ATCC 15381]|uniref:Helix-turn-helix transcriptional regulator n=1 Tax=Moritella marina ATCC 15381 TaxID=1202962 RepID=A0A5J6WTU3_MORMI|nr:AraC family transcriptional regulator [Moritella marina]QFI39822.1 helix-turn-helix transcriptional regulator [Moritella marina ATCC 15381]
MPLIKPLIDVGLDSSSSLLEPNEISFEQSTSKICLRQTSLTEALSWAHYQNENDRLYYVNDKQHTLSLYMSGGYETHRTDVDSGFGAPGKFCLMPKDSESHWQLGQTQQFMHLYFSDDYLKQLALKVFDIDPRMLQLPELTFTNDTATEALFRHCMATSDWHSGHDHLAMEQVTNTILVSMLQNMGITKLMSPIKGGLSPKVAAQVCDYMQANFHRQVYLSELAELAQLSEYHFCRMFKQSMAQTPQAYLLAIRIEQVKLRVAKSQASMADIALQCGFANQSHMGRYFKRLVGISPRQYRNLSAS